MAQATGGKQRLGKEPVLKAAIANFTERGYHATSMRDIARDADVTVASIYHHFPSKQDVLQEIMVQVLSDVISLTRTALLGAGREPADQLSALVRAWVLFHADRRAEAQIGASEMRSLDGPGRKLVVTLRDEQQRMFTDVIQRGVDEGAFATAYPKEATRAIINMGRALAEWYRPTGEVSPTEMAERYVALALGTVGCSPAPPTAVAEN
ncbi:TetR/AcrR family transcriptional regulator [Nocardioides sp. AE5]|uniref:TetR/AcrR family transcriptional regulator n=1 Tax=Nocardioides sp. AE5 TaxID=2962573 RepID=UPI0028826176|nr:TetR/AcrR family transcriptional regulator [Nocardioides sp. AE5]MDT0203242.1 TetR/AcrR family transcriptional regulator [Nocardioides sp. AE5]